MATPKKPSNGVEVNIRRDAKALLTAMKDAERTIQRYAEPLDKDGLVMAGMHLKLIKRQLDDLIAGVEGKLS